MYLYPRPLLLLGLLLILNGIINAQVKNNFVWETSVQAGNIVKNAGDVPDNRSSFFFVLNPSVQTTGGEEWHHIYRFPRAGCKITLGDCGNRNELGYLAGLTPNITLRTYSGRRINTSVNLGLGIAYFNKPYDEITNPHNFYIGSHLTALAEASVQCEYGVGKNLSLISGLRVVHCSNSHYQVPNLGLNILTLYMGVLINKRQAQALPERVPVEVPRPKVRFNIRSGIGVHELARTLGPAGSPKYAIYVNDFYVSRLFGRVSNVHAGL
ncbi:MAG: hypothetical protein HC830_04950, partial [Bacteroidetes bacterium]|nr:hypothetical protein [Bacteroidota bacterium]